MRSNKANLLIACLAPICTAAVSLSFAAEFKVVTQQSLEMADVTTHEISSGDVILGISEFGGGYINKLVIPGIGDILARHAARYGRGGQVSIRDSLHGGVYNPTQAGFTDTAGTSCSIERPSKRLLLLLSRPTALWNGDGKYDFTEWENLASDPYLNDRGNSDSDKIEESKLNGRQSAEITSEFDFLASYEDVRDGKTIKISAFKFSYEFRFIREPGHALSQFGKGTSAYNPSAAIADRSNLAPRGKHPSAEDSLTDITLSSALRGDKSVWNPKFIFFVDKNNKLELGNLPFRRSFFQIKRCINPLVILSASPDPADGPAIGYFHPCNHNNNYGVVGRFTTDHSVSYEDMRTSSGVLLGNDARTHGMWLIGEKTNHTGLLNIKETPKGVYEAIRGESYILIGAPNEILDATIAIHGRP